MNPEVHSSHCFCDLQNTDHLRPLRFTGRNEAGFIFTFVVKIF